MSEETTIEPALTAAEFRNEGMDSPSILGDLRYIDNPRDLAKVIALANHLLRDDDPRKMTREWVRVIRQRADALVGDIPKRFMDAEQAATVRREAADLRSIADALASYLPE